MKTYLAMFAPDFKQIGKGGEQKSAIVDAASESEARDKSIAICQANPAWYLVVAPVPDELQGRIEDRWKNRLFTEANVSEVRAEMERLRRPN